MTSPILSRRKWMLHAHNQHIVVVNGRSERFVHPLMKALIWALYLPDYPNSTIEVRIGDRYKPDVVAIDDSNAIYQQVEPQFWGEAGRIGKQKIESIIRRYPNTHFAIGKWDTRLQPYIDIVQAALKQYPREAPVDLISFPSHSADFIDDDGHIHITHDDVTWTRL